MAFIRTILVAFVAAAVAVNGAVIVKDNFAANVANGLRLIDLDPTVEPVWMTEDQKLELIRADKSFFDITDVYDPTASAGASKKVPSLAVDTARAGIESYPSPSRQAAVKPLVSQVTIANMQTYLTTLTAFNNRYYKAQTGADASNWIKNTIQSTITQYPASGASVALFSHSFIQSSIVAKFPGSSPSNPIVVLGAHMDSINSRNPTTGRAPGADDDGSGTVNLMEAFRVLASNGFKPVSPVEFHWYAGEEAGLLGSQAIATNYKSAGKKVKGMLQLDMTAYVKPGSKEVISLMPDYTNANLTQFVGQLVEAYSTLPWAINGACGYGCSDHASWDKQGYPTALPFEGTYPSNSNGKIHSDGDTTAVSGFSWSHTLEYAKLAVAYAYELGSL